jgi:hypothetical protein
MSKEQKTTIFLMCMCCLAFGSLLGDMFAKARWRPILIEHGAAYYTHDTGEFTIIRKEGE